MGNECRSTRHRYAPLACGVVLIVALLGWIVVSILNLRGPSDGGGGWSSTSKEPGAIGGKGAIDFPIMLLADYYEHGIEHAPPRDPSGCMQRREGYYTAPLNPFVLAHSKLSQSGADVELRKWMESRQSGFAVGKSAESAELKSLEPLLSASSLQSEVLLEIGRAFNFLEGDLLAGCWYRAGLAKAEQQYKDTKPGDPNAQPLLHLLDQTKALWRLKDYQAMEKRFALAKRLNAQLSPESRRARYLHAEMVFYQGRVKQAADLIVAVQAEHDSVGDLGSLEKSDLHEMAWVLGLMCEQAGRHSEAARYLETCIRLEGEHTGRAMGTRFWALLAEGRVDEAERQFEEYSRRFAPPPRVTAAIKEKIDSARISISQKRQASER